MITLGLVAKDEGKYLQEWIIYHKIIGIEKFIIYLHNCSDDSKQKLEKLNLDIDIRVKNTDDVGWEVKNDMYQNIIMDSNTRYSCCLDIDEFIFLPEININNFLSRFKNVGGIVLFQNVFGANGHVESPKGLVIENYIKRNPDNIEISGHYPKFDKPSDILKNIKVIINKDNLKKINSSHDYVCKRAVVDENGDVFSKYKRNRQLSKIRLNHYFTKSFEDWAFKTSRERFSKSSKYPNSWFKYYCDFDYVDREIRNKYAYKVREFLDVQNS